MTSTIITQAAAVSVAKRRVKLMRQADTAARQGNTTEAQRLDKIAHECELFLHAHGYPQYV